MSIDAFVETRLERGYDYGAAGGPEFNTTVISVKSGREWRTSNWSASRGKWQIGQRVVDRTDKDYLIAFFRARRGKAVGFRFKDWADWQATDEVLVADGSATAQLVKTYTDGGVDYVRKIAKPVAGTVVVTRNGAVVSGASVDTTTGIVTFPEDREMNIGSISVANPAVVTINNHGLTTGQVVYLTNTSVPALDSHTWTVTVIDANTFSIPYDNSAGAVINAGIVHLYPQPSDSISWSGEFDVPARFDVDSFQLDFEAYRESDGQALFQLHSIPVVEVLL
ncbi:MAG TPA: DUF2460 domain-containing protein [Gammaproteobacteria bacterium]|nr:DUF2460 domain-containing protein [Gammaproteobacteria bacterium]